MMYGPDSTPFELLRATYTPVSSPLWTGYIYEGPGPAVMTVVDFCDFNPSADDQFGMALGPGTPAPFWGGSVGAGHTGLFKEQWVGELLLQIGDYLQLYSVTSGGTTYTFRAFGYLVSTPPQASLPFVPV